MISKYKLIITGLLMVCAVVISGCIGEDSGTVDKVQIQNEIQVVLDEQCNAIENEDINALMNAFDMESSENYDEMKASWEMSFSEVNITKCDMVIMNLEVKDDVALVEIEGTLLSDGKTKKFTEKEKFRKVGSEWKQVY